MSKISAGTTTTTALVAEGDNTGQLIFQTNGTTTAMTIGTNQVVSLAQPLPVASGGTGSSSAAFVNLASNVTGTLPIANGGTGTTSTTFANLTTNVTGTLPIANGGTGQTSYTNGELLIGNSTGNTLVKATLTAGTGIAITNGAGTITIAASGGTSASIPFAYYCGNF